jgi:RNA polymerase sigma-70 factor (ECF subfamily)
LEGFEPTRPGAFLAYLRRALLNRIRDEIRKARRTPARADLPEEIEDRGRSPLELAIGRETLELYERALARLPQEQQEAIMMRIELGLSYREIATALGRPSENAARLFIVRALARLGEEIRGAGFEP